MRERILDYVRQYGGVSFAELQVELGKEAEGDLMFCYENRPNWVLWAGCSEEFVVTIDGLFKERLLTASPTSFLTYLCDGRVLELPIVKGNYKYKTPHWVPVALNANPPPSREERFRLMRKALADERQRYHTEGDA